MTSLGTTPNAGQVSILLFGSDGTWVWHNGWWRRPPTTGSPSFRQNAALVFDPLHHEAVMFGGVGTCSGCGYLNDTWAWTGSTWVQQTSANEPSPLNGTPQMVYDSVVKRSILYQAQVAEGVVGPVNETWSWDGTNWSQLQPVTSPWLGNASPSMAYDAAKRQVLLFGGRDPYLSPLDDTWVLMPRS